MSIDTLHMIASLANIASSVASIVGVSYTIYTMKKSRHAKMWESGAYLLIEKDCGKTHSLAGASLLPDRRCGNIFGLFYFILFYSFTNLLYIR